VKVELGYLAAFVGVTDYSGQDRNGFLTVGLYPGYT
jgi:hypothetical protein